MAAPQPSAPAAAQKPTGTLSLCNGAYSIGPPAKLPPAGSGPIVYLVALCFAKQGGTSVIDPQTYLYYIGLRWSLPSQDKWVPYNDASEDQIQRDFKALWGTNFLDDLSAETADYVFSNGVVGKIVLYNMEERQRVKIVDYVGSKKVEQSKIDEELKKKGIQIRLDSFIDQGLVRRVAGVVRDMYAEKGYEFAEVKPEIKEVTGGPKTVNLTFNITEGPKVKIRTVEFIGNKDISDSKLAKKMKDNKAPGFFGFITGGGTYQEAKFEEDAQKVIDYYRERGYVKAQVGQPELKIMEDAKDAKTRFIELQIPVTEGQRYKIGDLTFSGNSVVKSEGLRPLFKLNKGDWYNEKFVHKGFEKAKELYGSGGYWEFTGYPDLAFPNEAQNGDGDGDGKDGAGPPAPPAAKPAATAPEKAVPIVNVTMRMEEGKQYFINRITFVGNTTTRDNVIRREVRLFEGGIFNTEALKYSVRRINQLGYFKPLEAEAVDVQKVPDAENKVDLKLKVEEQNRNQITFGAGVSQYEGFFGQLAFQTSNFMGRGETFSVSLAAGQSREELPGRVHRTIPVRSPDHRRRRRVQPGDPVPGRVHAGLGRREHRLGISGGSVLALLRQLQLPERQGQGSQSALQDRCGDRQQPVPGRFAAARRGRVAPHQQDRTRAGSTTRSTTRSSRPPAAGMRSISIWRGWAATAASTAARPRASGT